MAQGAPTPVDPGAGGVIPPVIHQDGPTPLSPQETHPDIKSVASEIALAMTTYDPGEDLAQIAARLATVVGDTQAAVELAQILFVPQSWSRGRIVYPQFGGLQPDRASVMVVTEQMIGTAEGVFVFVRTLDIRLMRAGGQWRFESLASAGGEPVEPPAALPEIALAVLNDPRIELPDSARWDIFANRVSPVLLGVMSRMADQAPYGVVTLVSGHPWEIFGTDRQSDHTRGLAVDIYRVGDRLVIDDRAEGSVTHSMVRWLHAQPDVARVGSPWRLTASTGRAFFTDALHQDHLHVAVPPP